MKKITILLFMLFCFILSSWSQSCNSDPYAYNINSVQSINIGRNTENYTDYNDFILKINTGCNLYIYDENGNKIYDYILWTSSDSNIITVDENGYVQAIDFGDATVTATLPDGISDTVEITVSDTIHKNYALPLSLPHSLTVYVGDIIDFNNYLPENYVSVKEKTWVTSNTNIISIIAEGIGKAYNAGTATVSIKIGMQTASCKVTVLQKRLVTGVKLDKTSVTVNIGDIVPLTATVLPSNATNKAVEWRSDNTKVVKVNSKGEFKAYKAGTATVYVRTIDGKKVASCKVTVNKNIPVTGVKLDKTSVTVNIGDIVPLTATVLPENATNKAVEWRSDNTKVVKVNSKGEFKAYKAGTATVYVRTIDGKKVASCKVTVNKNIPVTGVKLDKTSVTVNIGDIVPLTATVLPSNATNKKVEWKSSDTSIVKVNSKGEFKAYKAGTATVYVRTVDGKFIASCKVTVQKNVPVTGVKLNKTSVTANVGDIIALTATVLPSNATNKKVEWKSSNTNIVKVNAKGEFKTYKEGTATVSVRTVDGKFTASCKITVKTLPIGDVKVTVTAPTEKYNSAYNLKYSAAKHLITVKVSLPAGMADTKLNYVWTLDRENGTVIANSDSVYSDAEFIYRPNDTSSIPADVTAGTERIYNRGFKIKSSFVGRYIFLSVKTSSGAVCSTVKFYVDEPAAPPTPTGR